MVFIVNYFYRPEDHFPTYLPKPCPLESTANFVIINNFALLVGVVSSGGRAVDS